MATRSSPIPTEPEPPTITEANGGHKAQPAQGEAGWLRRYLGSGREELSMRFWFFSAGGKAWTQVGVSLLRGRWMARWRSDRRSVRAPMAASSC